MLSMKNFSYLSSISQSEQIAQALTDYKIKDSRKKLKRKSSIKKKGSSLSNSSSNSEDDNIGTNTTATNIIYHIKKSAKTLYQNYNQLKNTKEKMNFLAQLEPKEFKKLMKRLHKK